MRICLIFAQLTFWTAVTIIVAVALAPVYATLAILSFACGFMDRQTWRRRSRFRYRAGREWRTVGVSYALFLLETNGGSYDETIAIVNRFHELRDRAARGDVWPVEWAAFFGSPEVLAAASASRSAFELPPFDRLTGEGADDIDALDVLFRFHGHAATKCRFQSPANNN